MPEMACCITADRNLSSAGLSKLGKSCRSGKALEDPQKRNFWKYSLNSRIPISVNLFWSSKVTGKVPNLICTVILS